ncbi:cytochrome c [Erythrobacter sp. SG61-1L]|uniref:c-type cytochrome n=1 Tax=Erythrobacter sp. SG61-1L TaxID=1603897 RepID=UPI0006C8F9E2|nr:cytochrome c [Erythrobacter sp. SG61-1L]
MKALPLAALAGLLALGGIAHAEGQDESALDEGRQIFRDTGCNQCHKLADANSAATYAPSLDGNPHMSRELVLDRLTNGRGDMPSFTGILTDEQIATLADYVSRVAVPAAGAGSDTGGAAAH